MLFFIKLFLPIGIVTITFAIQVMAAGLRMGMPLIITSLGEIYAERSGVFNLGVDRVYWPLFACHLLGLVGTWTWDIASGL